MHNQPPDQRKDHRPKPARRDRMIQEHNHDPYKAAKKAESSVCPQCGAVCEHGRWRWGLRPVEAEEAPCPACRRINDRLPAGMLTLTGAYVRGHREEILATVRHQQQLEASEHPLHRIMDTQSTPEGFQITTTDIHLPRRIAEALRGAHGGDLTLHYDDDAYFARVQWRHEGDG